MAQRRDALGSLELPGWKATLNWIAAVLTASRNHGGADFMVYEDDRWIFERHFLACAHLATLAAVCEPALP